MSKIERFNIAGSLQGVKELEKHLQRIASNWGVSNEQLFEINLILEEICVNSIEHGGSSITEEIEMLFSLDDSSTRDRSLIITIIDHSPEFDPTKAVKPDIQLPLAQRKTGGLGLHLVRQYADRISYSRTKNTNILTIEKKLQPSDD